MSPNSTLYINLPATSLSASLEFYIALGFQQNHEYSNDKAAMVTLPANITETPLTLMLATHDFFEYFLGEKRQMIDAKKHSEVILCVSMPTKEAVDKILEQAKSAGAQIGVTTTMEMPNMYGGSFADLDGHIFELLCDLNAR